MTYSIRTLPVLFLLAALLLPAHAMAAAAASKVRVLVDGKGGAEAGDVLLGSHFYVTLDDIKIPGVFELKPGKLEFELAKRKGKDGRTEHYLKEPQLPSLFLRAKGSHPTMLNQWYNFVMKQFGKPGTRRTLALIHVDEKGEERRRVEYVDCVPQSFGQSIEVGGASTDSLRTLCTTVRFKTGTGEGIGPWVGARGGDPVTKKSSKDSRRRVKEGAPPFEPLILMGPALTNRGGLGPWLAAAIEGKAKPRTVTITKPRGKKGSVTTTYTGVLPVLYNLPELSHFLTDAATEMLVLQPSGIAKK